MGGLVDGFNSEMPFMCVLNQARHISGCFSLPSEKSWSFIKSRRIIQVMTSNTSTVPIYGHQNFLRERYYSFQNLNQNFYSLFNPIPSPRVSVCACSSRNCRTVEREKKSFELLFITCVDTRSKCRVTYRFGHPIREALK